MKSRRRWVRILRLSAAGVGVLLLAAVAFVPIQQRVLRWRAERLLNDIRAIEMGKSTLADARRLMRKWGASGEWQGDCAKDWCEYRIWIDDVSHALHRFPVLDGGNWGPHLRWPRWVNKPYSWAGGRFADVEAEFEVRNGVIWSKSFAVLVTPFPETYNSEGELNAVSRFSLIARAQTSPACFHRGFRSAAALFSAANPEICLLAQPDWALAQFTPFADEKIVGRLLDFNLDCITRWKNCPSSRELMPTAVSLFETSRKQVKTSIDQDDLQSLPFWIIARDLEYVAIGEPLTSPRIHANDQHPRLQAFRILKLLKGSSLISGAGIYMVNTIGSEEKCSVMPNQATIFNPENKALMAFNEPLNQDPARDSDFSPCVVVPVTEQNLAAAEHGIARDMVLRDSAVY